MTLHAYAVAEYRAARERAAGIDADHTDLAFPAPATRRPAHRRASIYRRRAAPLYRPGVRGPCAGRVPAAGPAARITVLEPAISRAPAATSPLSTAASELMRRARCTTAYVVDDIRGLRAHREDLVDPRRSQRGSILAGSRRRRSRTCRPRPGRAAARRPAARGACARPTAS